METYDLAIIGAGPGGYVAAIRAAQLGLRPCLVERYPSLGGTCLNVGCIPSKALLESSELFHAASTRLAEHGIDVGGAPRLDLAAMMARKQRIVKELTDGVAGLMKKNRVTVLQGAGSLAARDRVKVSGEAGEQELEAKHIILATGSASVELPFLGFDGQRVVSSTGALAFDQVPRHLVVIGAGAVGLELGSVWRRLGAAVTVVEMMPQIVPAADGQMAKALQRSLKALGLQIRLKTRVTAAETGGEQVRMALEDVKGKTEQLEADRVLVSVGRRPFTEGLGLEAVGVETDGAMVKVDERLQTSVEGIFAIGDLVRGPMLAHKAEEEGIAAAETIAGRPGHVNYDAIPSVVYTSPELAWVGLTEEQCKEQGIKPAVGRFLFRANGRAKALGEEEGMVKILAHPQTDRILGVHILGPRASDLIAEAVLGLEFAASAEDIARTMHAHPTLSEVVKEAALAVAGRAIHG